LAITLNRNTVVAIIIIAIAIPAILFYVNTIQTEEEQPIDQPKKDENLPVNIENIGGKYNTTIEFFEERIELE